MGALADAAPEDSASGLASPWGLLPQESSRSRWGASAGRKLRIHGMGVGVRGSSHCSGSNGRGNAALSFSRARIRHGITHRRDRREQQQGKPKLTCEDHELLGSGHGVNEGVGLGHISLVDPVRRRALPARELLLGLRGTTHEAPNLERGEGGAWAHHSLSLECHIQRIIECWEVHSSIESASNAHWEALKTQLLIHNATHWAGSYLNSV